MRFLGWLKLAPALACLATTAPAHPLTAQVGVDRAVRQELRASGSTTFQTRKGFAACASREGLVKLITHIFKEETEAHRAMMNDTSSGCFRLKAGVAVEAVGYNEYFVELRPVGMKGTIFTVVEAIEPKEERHEQR